MIKILSPGFIGAVNSCLEVIVIREILTQNRTLCVSIGTDTIHGNLTKTSLIDDLLKRFWRKGLNFVQFLGVRPIT